MPDDNHIIVYMKLYLDFSTYCAVERNGHLYNVNRRIFSKMENGIVKLYYIAIDKKIVPFRDCLKCRQHIPEKAHKYDVKVFKISELYKISGYIHGENVYADKNKVNGKVVLKLSNNFLISGRTINTDNFYTSLLLLANF
jgi:hypothetical protein